MQKIPTPENPEVSHIFSFEPGVGQIFSDSKIQLSVLSLLQ